MGDDTKGLFFFPEYTDHGPKHVSSVLAGADALILEDAWKAVTPEDVAVLVTAVLLHDSAMHLSADGFLALLDPARSAERPVLRPLDDKTWPELFEAFFAEARRWDQRKLHRILGDEATPAEMEPDLVDSIKRPADVPNPETWSVRYRKFLGEFIRRHHARLAHEIALSGFPGHQPNVLVPPPELSGLADLAGLVARSHNMHLRDTFSYLETKYWGRLTCRNAHPVFLMVLLRIADYLEIRADRVNPTALQIQRLRSPISQEEQASHLSVHEVRPDEHDEEAIFVIAKPATARMFLKLQGLLKGLQAELDTSWAVLGEVYSRNPELRCFGIRLRRVRSNLDVPADFLRREEPTYFPVQAAFDTTGADLLKLLIKPLYGDAPEIGVRELLQNALDAVHELRQWARDHGDPAMEKIPLPQQEADVLISIDRDEAGEVWLTVRDKGIGMTAGVVRDYFLKAGASYRQSTAWRQSFEDEKGLSKVLRSGRFGVGALAAFLLGDRIIVSTRHVGAQTAEGVAFSASISDQMVELGRARLLEVGTIVRVKLGQAALKSLEEDKAWDWYTARNPKVERRSFGRSLKQRYILPLGDAAGSGWSEIFCEGYKGVAWGFTNKGSDKDSSLFACNGIIVRPSQISQNTRIYPFDAPSIAVLDPDRMLPLNLQRNGFLTSETPFEDEALAEATCELCAFLLSWGPTSKLDYGGIKSVLESIGWPLFVGYAGMRANLWPICFADEGFTLLHGEILRRAKMGLIVLDLLDAENINSIETSRDGACGFVCDSAELLFTRQYRIELLSIVDHILMSQQSIVEHIQGDWGVRRSKRSHMDGELKTLELTLRNSGLRLQDKFVGQIAAILDSLIIPYDPAERRQQLPRAFERLEKHLERWKPENLTGWRLEQVKWFRGGIDPVSEATSKPKKGRSRSRRS